MARRSTIEGVAGVWEAVMRNIRPQKLPLRVHDPLREYRLTVSLPHRSKRLVRKATYALRKLWKTESNTESSIRDTIHVEAMLPGTCRERGFVNVADRLRIA